MSTPADPEASAALQGVRLALVGKWASMSKREAAALVRRHGGMVIEKPDASVDLVVVGERELPLADTAESDRWFDSAVREAIDAGTVQVIMESRLWQRLGLVEAEHDVHRLYTPAMLAELVGVPVAVIRRWHRRGLIMPVREVRKLAYFDFQEVATARRLAELLAAGMSPATIESKLEALSRVVPGVKRPLAQLSVIVEGKEILLRQGDGLVEPGGQLRFDFAASEPPAHGVEPAEASPATGTAVVLSLAGRRGDAEPPPTPEALFRIAAELEESGDLTGAADMLRAAMAAGGPSPEACFQLAECLYRLGDSSGARERYFMAIELDEDYVEARANLGCVLAETGQRELATAAFEGALAYHPDYPDAHYHLARTLDELGRGGEAEAHWRAFLDLSPDSPWSDQARARVGKEPGASGGGSE